MAQPQPVSLALLLGTRQLQAGIKLRPQHLPQRPADPGLAPPVHTNKGHIRAERSSTSLLFFPPSAPAENNFISTTQKAAFSLQREFN